MNKEPAKTYEYLRLPNTNKFAIVKVGNHGTVAVTDTLAQAERIVDCLNFCHGTSSEHFRFATLDDLLDTVIKIANEGKELKAAIDKYIRPHVSK